MMTTERIITETKIDCLKKLRVAEKNPKSESVEGVIYVNYGKFHKLKLRFTKFKDLLCPRQKLEQK